MAGRRRTGERPYMVVIPDVPAYRGIGGRHVILNCSPMQALTGVLERGGRLYLRNELEHYVSEIVKEITWAEYWDEKKATEGRMQTTPTWAAHGNASAALPDQTPVQKMPERKENPQKSLFTKEELDRTRPFMFD